MTTTRREFVTLGTIGLLGAKQLFGESIARVAGTEQAAAPILSVGYWDGLTRGEGAQTPTTHIENAQASGMDSRFRRASAMVTTYGYWRAPANRAIPVSLSLIAFYPEIDPETKKKIPFIAWNVVVSANRVDGNLRSTFKIPVDDQNRVEIAIDKHVVLPAKDYSLDDTRALIDDRSTVIDLGDAVTLRRGYYFIALRDRQSQDVPDWTRIRVSDFRSTDRVRPDGDSILLGADGNPVNFDYIVLLIEPYGISSGRDSSAPDHRS